MAKYKILLIGPFPPPFHGQSVSFQMLYENIKQSHECMVLNISGKYIGKSGGKVSFGRLFDFLGFFGEYLKLLCKRPATVYLTIAQSKHGFIRDIGFIWGARLFRCKVIVHLKGGNYRGFYNSQSQFFKRLIRLTLHQTHKILVLGERLVQMFDFDLSLHEKIAVVENGLPLKPNKSISAKEISNTKPVKVLFLSNLIESKGYFDLLKAAELLRHKYGFHNLEFHFAGEFIKYIDDVTVKSVSDAEERFKEMIAQYELSEVVYYHGIVSGQEKTKLLVDGHIFVLPTNYINEGQPVSIIESMAYAMPIITTDFRAINDLVIDEVNGFFVEYASPDQIAEKINQLNVNPVKYHQMSAASLEQFYKKFTTEKHLERIIPHLVD